MASKNQSQFQDFLPIMADKLGGDGLIGELCNGFQLLMDGEKGVITFDSLKNNSALLGLQDLTDDDLLGMLKEGDFDGDGALSQMEFCVLMFRLSPDLMDQSQYLDFILRKLKPVPSYRELIDNSVGVVTTYNQRTQTNPLFSVLILEAGNGVNDQKYGGKGGLSPAHL
ncbi:hypothetical protein RJ640_004589 [Escallonia rubra]|uniref:EF-hand domain-containing protein n=1 Tax=Escallonia rubra TaxID=112253 RepID=A0AA88UH51_9ASTE|nr:hypothetical protein RJ640_004589 [Escallonia rubra]